jgi:Beta-lactamase enzyme family
MGLGEALRAAVIAQDFGATPDRWQGGAPVAHCPSIDLAVAAFPPGQPAVWANVLFSREHPLGVVADIDTHAGALLNVRFDADQRDAQGESVAWLPGADWARLRWQPLAGRGAHRFVAPYPASLLKLMVAVGVALAVDRGLADWPAALESMITVSDNDATTACVALLHRVGLVGTLNQRLRELGLATLQVNDTRPDGGWRNADGAGVGHIHMTAWDTVRLLWLLDAQAPPPPWLPPGSALLSETSRAHLHGVLRRQVLDEILSSGALRGVPGWVPGGPDAPAFAHKTGTTDNYASDAGIVQAGSTHYIVAVLTSLGRRHAAHERCATTWRLPTLGAAVHQLMETLA